MLPPLSIWITNLSHFLRNIIGILRHMVHFIPLLQSIFLHILCSSHCFELRLYFFTFDLRCPINALFGNIMTVLPQLTGKKLHIKLQICIMLYLHHDQLCFLGVQCCLPATLSILAWLLCCSIFFQKDGSEPNPKQEMPNM